MLLVLVAVAGCRPDPAARATSQSETPSWLVGTWFHDEGREGYADYADYSLTLGADGSFVWQTGSSTLVGEWSAAGSAIDLEGARPLGHTAACHVIGLDGRSYLDRANDVGGCPTQPVPLSAVEACAVGRFTWTTPNGGSASYRLDADRTFEELFDDPGYTSGGSAYARYGEFALDAAGNVVVTYPSGGAEVRTTVASLLGVSREGAVAAGCDMAAFMALGGATCPPASSVPLYTCAEPGADPCVACMCSGSCQTAWQACAADAECAAAVYCVSIGCSVASCATLLHDPTSTQRAQAVQVCAADACAGACG
ncbi:MAG: hypothetical protein IT373_11405 [Polyangiaceae bacterium]|nr:hypothetical protein [Polyangiaceae bacterium]